MYREITVLIFLSNVGAFDFNLNNFKEGDTSGLQKTAYIDGDFIIGALFPIHSRPKDDNNPLKCGSIKRSEGIELVEAAIFAIDTINNDKDFLPGIKLGINIKDDCEDERVALYQTMNIIREPKFENNMPNSSIPGTCNNGPSKSPLIGMLGTVAKLNMLHYENLLKLFKIPQIGYSTSLSQLISPFFYLSVVPSDYHLSFLIIKVLLRFGWNYISVAYNEEYLGKNGKYFLEEWVSTYNICISNSVHIPRPDQDIRYVQTVKHLFQNDKAKVIVCFCDEITLKVIFKEMRKFNLTGKYYILNSNKWPISEDLLRGYEKQAEGMLMLAHRRNLVPGFEDYISSLRLENNKRNPWFEEYSRYKSIQLSSQNAKIAYVVKSIHAFARGLKEMSETCKPYDKNCLKKKPFNTTKYMNYLANLTFLFDNEDVEFSFYGSPQIGKFDIYNFQNVNDSFKFVKVGDYDCYHENTINEDSMKRLNIFGQIKYPKGEKIASTCSEQCEIGYAQVNDKEHLCCWQCISCEETEYVNNSNCEKCPQGYLANDNKTACNEAPLKYLSWNDRRSLVAMGTSSSIIILAFLTANIFIRNRHTPVIKSSCTPLYYIVLCGVIILSSTSFVLIIQPNTLVCALVKILPTVAISLIYIPVIFNTLQIFCVLKAMKNRDSKFPWVIRSFKAQTIIISIIVILEVITLIIWMVHRGKPLYKMTYEKEPETVVHLKCKFGKKNWIDIAFIIMHVVMIYYAIKIRKMSHNFHEAKFIAIFTFVQTSTNVAFRIVYNSSDFQIVSMFIGCSIDSFITLLLLFFPKLYIIIWRPEINTDDNFKSFVERYYTYSYQ